ncbi:MAG: RNA 2',3'-cyclic phosphodiesterase [Candidatus Promineifilaceae bacterium]
MAETFRAFVAVSLPEEVIGYLGKLIEDLAAQVPPRSVRWTQPDKMHLTLRFLGDTKKDLLQELQNALDSVTQARKPFSLQLQGFGCFPNCRRPRVLWAGLGGNLDAAAGLKAAIDEAIVPFGWEREERPFSPHLTLGRVKDASRLDKQRWPETVEPLPIPVAAVHLVQSDLTPGGPIYTIRHTSTLRGL